MSLVLYFFAGMMTWNSIPHLVKGITGQTHMTPFRRVSSPYLNIVWSFVNLLLGSYILGLASGSNMVTMPWASDLTGVNLMSYLAGAFTLSLTAAWLFGRPNARLPWHKD